MNVGWTTIRQLSKHVTAAMQCARLTSVLLQLAFGWGRCLGSPAVPATFYNDDYFDKQDLRFFVCGQQNGT